MTIKDSFDDAGMRTAYGRLSDAHQATSDAPAVALLRSAVATGLSALELGSDLVGSIRVATARSWARGSTVPKTARAG